MSIEPFSYNPKTLPPDFRWIGAIWYPCEYAADRNRVKCAMANVAEDSHGGLWIFGVHAMMSTWQWFFELNKISDEPLQNLPMHFMAMATPQTVETATQNVASSAQGRL